MTAICQTLEQFFSEQARRHDAAPALSDGIGLTISYRDLDRIAGEIRADLRALGLARQDRIAVIVPQVVPAALAMLGAAAALTVLPFHPRHTAGEAADLMTRAGVRALLAPRGSEDGGSAAAADLGVPVLEFAWDPSRSRLAITGRAVGPAAADVPAVPGDYASLLHTSGTTGRPRIAPRTQAATIGVARNSIMDATLGPGNRSVVIPPLPYAFGQNDVMAILSTGALAILAGAIDPSDVSGIVHAYSPDWLVLTPAHLATWTRQHCDQAGDRPTTVRWVASGGAALTDDLHAEAERTLGIPVLNVYGSSETGMMSFQSFPPAAMHGNAGHPVMDLRVVDDEGRDLPPGQPGRLLANGPTVFPGYLDDPEATARAFAADGWHVTGDRAILHADGSLSLLGRGDAVINRAGDKIDPAEVEAALRAHAAVRDCAVFAVPHPRFGNEPAAVVQLAPGASVSQRDLRRWLLDRLSPQKVPRRIMVVESMPRTPTGKIPRAALAALLDGPVKE